MNQSKSAVQALEQAYFDRLKNDRLFYTQVVRNASNGVLIFHKADPGLCWIGPVFQLFQSDVSVDIFSLIKERLSSFVIGSAQAFHSNVVQFNDKEGNKVDLTVRTGCLDQAGATVVILVQSMFIHQLPASVAADDESYSMKQLNLLQSKIDNPANRAWIHSLIEKEERYRTIVESVPGAVLRYKIDANGVDSLLFLSKGAKNVWEFEPEEVMNDVSLLWKTVQPEDLPGLQESILKSAANLTEWDHVWRLNTKDGKQRWINGRGIPKRMNDGGTVWETLILDITNSKEVEETLRERDLQLVKLTDAVPGVIYQFEASPEGAYRFTFLSNGFKRMFSSIDPEAVMDNPGLIFQLVHEEDVGGYLQAIETSRQQLTSFDIRFRVAAPDGKPNNWYRAVSIPESLPDGGVAWYGFFFDITKEVNDRYELSRLANVAENSNDLLLTCNEHGEIVWANNGFQRMLGDSMETWQGKNLNEFFDNDVSFGFDQARLASAIRNKESYLCLAPVKSRADARVWLNLHINPIFNEKGEFVYSIVSLSDVTALLNKQKELEGLIQQASDQSDRFKQYGYITSHNIRSSVARIMGLSELLRLELGDSDMLSMLVDSTSGLDSTINNINDLLVLERDFENLVKRDYELKGALERQIESNIELIQTKKASLEVEVAENLVLHTIPAYIDSIFFNLISNALKYGITEMSKIIRISLQESATEIVVVFEDTGMGIDLEKYKDRIFKLGSRLHESSKGNGLGLFITKRQVEILGGSISVSSQPNVGTRFEVVFPKVI